MNFILSIHSEQTGSNTYPATKFRQVLDLVSGPERSGLRKGRFWVRPRFPVWLCHPHASSQGYKTFFLRPFVKLFLWFLFFILKSFSPNFANFLCLKIYFWGWVCCMAARVFTLGRMVQGILKGDVSLYCWPPVWLVSNQLYDNWQFLFLFAKQTNPNQSNRRSMVQWYFPL